MKAGILICGLLLGVIVWNAVAAVPTTWSQEPPPAAADGADVPEVLTRGPIHEAFAEPLTDPEPGIIVPKKPPADIDEVPPEYAPDLEGAIWIKGYWAWDDEREDYIWISGVHRVPPPGMRWMAGFWDEIEEKGWRWNRGFWIKTDVEELSYREAPPASLEAGPSSPSPGDDYFYVPGHWAYDADYRWSPGYWALYRPDWVWVPAHWVWTPGGYVFVPGYCDYGVARRGCLYAPVYFHTAFYAQPGYYYRPYCALNVGNLMIHFWVRPTYCHYYFGDYYGVWSSCGMTPWYQWSYQHHHHCYDPILVWSDVHYHRRGIDYSARMGGWHKHYESHEHDRPPRTWNDQVKLVSQTNITNITQINNVKNVAVRQDFLVAKVDDMAKVQDAPVKLHKLEGKQLETAKQNAKLMNDEVVQLREQRRKFEKPVAIKAGDKPGELALSEPAQSKAKGTGEKGAKGSKADRSNKADPGDTAEARGASRGKLKLPESKIKPTLAKVDVPPAPARGTPRATAGGEVTGNQGTKGVEKSAKGMEKSAKGLEKSAKSVEKSAKGIEKSKAGGGGVTGQADGASGAKGKGAGRERGGAESSPKVETPKIELPDNKPAKPSVEGAAPRVKPREQAPQAPMPPSPPGTDQSPRSNGSGENKSAVPRVETPAASPPAELPAPRSSGPSADIPRIERGTEGAPRVTRPAASERSGDSAARIEPRTVQPRVDTPTIEPRAATPRVEVSRAQPRVETSRPQRATTQPSLRPSSPPTRVERSQPRSDSRSSNKKRD